MSDIAQGVLSFLGSGLENFARGRQVQRQNRIADEERKKRDDRLRKKEEIELEDRNRRNQGELDFIQTMSAIGSMNPNAPLSAFQGLNERGLIAAQRAGIPIERAHGLLQNAANKQPELDPIQQANLDLVNQRVQKEKSLTDANVALEKQRLESIKKIRNDVRKANRRDKDKDTKTLLGEINDLQIVMEGTPDHSPRTKVTLRKRLDQLTLELAKKHNIPTHGMEKAALREKLRSMDIPVPEPEEIIEGSSKVTPGTSNKKQIPGF